MVYAEVELKRKVDWRIVFTRNKENRTEYAKIDVLDNFSFSNKMLGLDLYLMHVEPIENSLKSTKIVQDKDSMEKTICFTNSRSKSKDKEGAIASRKLDSTLRRLEGDIQDVESVGGPSLNFIELQRDLLILISKYEFL